MSSFDVVLIVFQIFVLFFTISVQCCTQAWVALRLGDPTAKMLGRLTLNPLQHLDVWGMLVFPIYSLLRGGGLMIGWGKQVPVTQRNFKHYKRDDNITALAGPASNLGLAFTAVVLLLVLKHTMAGGVLAIQAAVLIAFHFQDIDISALPALFPIALLLYFTVIINCTLFIFNLIPIPPLDGSRILRNYLSYNALKTYDSIGMWWMLIFFVAVGPIVGIFYPIVLGVFNGLLAAL
ncbi:Zn-dependent protease (includes SpoIVFB) [Granulicella pectinivorans]|jgi:Zn-dependent protease|uniref:Zn-dependent protease (Includes SpoIVFB) n=1 Tax=Granulicella pectinivorans TaxID=474950 RepID=A0A1I6LA15_9BACT|nr:site-2 protease family protein [Granulicella pectinivorans]SFS00070.1 Zn-dependent protease (includes SpoIVFB) [Granulicella pectinivorans]